MMEGWGKVTEITLSSSKIQVKVISNDFACVAQHLLTDPQIMWDNYLWFDDELVTLSPDNLDYMEDVNTGAAYVKTYCRLIKNPCKQVLMGVQFYMDGAMTGQFSNLQVTAVQCAFTIFNQKAQEQDHFWGTLGYVPKYTKEISRGHRMFRESGHVDSIFCDVGDDDEGNVEARMVVKAQDLHDILDVILASYVDVQETGFYWDLSYKNKVYEGIKFVLFTPNLWVDTDEADKVCGHYSSQSQHVANIC
jgi:hypothetical protein